MKKITKKEAFMGVLVGGLVVLLLVYLMVFSKYNEKTDSLKASNNSLRTEVESIRGYYENKAIYESEKAQMEELIWAMVDEYPADAKEEDAIMLGVEMQEKADVEYTTISMPLPEDLYMVPQEDVEGAKIEGLAAQLDFADRGVTYECELDYENLKTCVQAIYDNPNRIAIQDVTLQKNETLVDNELINSLKGHITISMYSMEGTGKEYEAPDMEAYLAGTTNPFKLIKVTE